MHYVTYNFHERRLSRTFLRNRNTDTALLIIVNQLFNGFTFADSSLRKSFLELLAALESSGHLTGTSSLGPRTVTLKNLSNNLTFFWCVLNLSLTSCSLLSLERPKNFNRDLILETSCASGTGKFA